MEQEKTFLTWILWYCQDFRAGFGEDNQPVPIRDGAALKALSTTAAWRLVFLDVFLLQDALILENKLWSSSDISTSVFSSPKRSQLFFKASDFSISDFYLNSFLSWVYSYYITFGFLCEVFFFLSLQFVCFPQRSGLLSSQTNSLRLWLCRGIKLSSPPGNLLIPSLTLYLSSNSLLVFIPSLSVRLPTTTWLSNPDWEWTPCFFRSQICPLDMLNALNVNICLD